jgi:hypothetical protein
MKKFGVFLFIMIGCASAFVLSHIESHNDSFCRVNKTVNDYFDRCN